MLPSMLVHRASVAPPPRPDADACGRRSLTPVTSRRPTSGEPAMFERTYYATHPDMMECVSNEELRDRYLIQGLFREGECVLNYTHADRFVIGGVAGRRGRRCAARRRPSRPRPPAIPSSSGASWRSSMSARSTGTVTVDGEALRARQQGLPLRHDGREGRDLRRRRARASISPPARRIRRSRRASCRSPRPMRWSAAASRNRTSGPSTSSSSPASATAPSWSWA